MSSKTSYFNPTIAILTFLLAATLDQGWGKSVVLAQTDKFNPLEVTTFDPLLPNPPGKRPLSPLERSKLDLSLQELNTQANTLYTAGNVELAFTIWYREVRLRRVLGKLEEVQALGSLGAIAWKESRKTDLQIIDERLKAIQQEASLKKELNPELLSTLGQAYQQVRNINKALEIYLQILANTRKQEDVKEIEAVLLTIGKLYLAKFDYPQAALTYEELLTLAQQEKDYFNQGIYLRQLADIYTQAMQPENAARIKRQIADEHLKNKQIQPLPALYISIASDYQALNQPEAASQNYQEAFKIAWSLQQFAAASEALQKLGDLYRAYGEKTLALQIYQELLKVEQQSYNLYGLMSAYDRIGQIQLEQKNFASAKSAFEQGLAIAKSLKYQESYFASQIQQVNQQMLEPK